MKNLISTIMILAIVLGGVSISIAQDAEPKEKEIKIQTSAICGMCEERIETNMAFEKGVKSVELDDKTKIVTIVYKTGKTDPDKIRKAISKLGYDADDVEADPEAYEKLPKCCKKDNEPH
ncbi:MAG TPA: heavy metal-associated domain-containing protein [Bacteroidales bacterium]|nr:heavy metal-associated domain-containing protein [Bacteroidales bacterium]